MNQARESGIRWAALAAAGALLVWHARVFDFVNDDAFISFRYADNLVRHGELVYNLGERVEGYTNFLWTMVMAGVLWLGLDPVPWSKGLGIALAGVALFAVARYSAQTRGRASAWDALAPLLLAAAPAYACWATGGLETALFTCLVTLGWTAYLREQADDARGFPLSGVWFALSAMARPEGLLFFGLAGLHRVVRLGVFLRRLPTKRDWLWGLGFAGVFGPYFLWRLLYYGYPFPNTYYVKTGAKKFWGPGGRYVLSWAQTHGLWAAPALAAARRHLPRGDEARFLALAVLFVGALCVHVARVGGDFMALHRFLVPVMPMLALIIADGVRRLAEPWLTRRSAQIGVAALGIAAAAGATVHVRAVDRAALVVGSEQGVDSIGWLKMFAGQCTAIGKWLAENAPPDTSIATTAAGIIPFYSRLYTLDQLGLNDEWVAHNVEPSGNRPGHTKAAPWSYIFEKRIDALICHPSPTRHRSGGGGCGMRRAPRGYAWKAVQVPGLEPPWWGYWARISRP